MKSPLLTYKIRTKRTYIKLPKGYMTQTYIVFSHFLKHIYIYIYCIHIAFCGYQDYIQEIWRTLNLEND
jgi:hypothetical protein